MEWNDPSTWIAYASVPLIIASIIPFNVSIPLFFTKYLFISITIVSINWIIGSSWIIKISELSNPLKSQSLNKEGSRLAISSSPIPSSFLPFIFYGVGILQIVAERVPVIGGLIIVIINVFIEIIFCFMNIIFAIYLKISFKLSYISSKLLKKRLSILSILFAFLILLILT